MHLKNKKDPETMNELPQVRHLSDEEKLELELEKLQKQIDEEVLTTLPSTENDDNVQSEEKDVVNASLTLDVPQTGKEKEEKKENKETEEEKKKRRRTRKKGLRAKSQYNISN